MCVSSDFHYMIIVAKRVHNNNITISIEILKERKNIFIFIHHDCQYLYTATPLLQMYDFIYKCSMLWFQNHCSPSQLQYLPLWHKNNFLKQSKSWCNSQCFLSRSVPAHSLRAFVCFFFLPLLLHIFIIAYISTCWTIKQEIWNLFYFS